jgi:hypothetical protein
MRKRLAVSLCALALAIPGASTAQDQPGWSYAYANGVAMATQRDDRGRVTATMACQPPVGDIILSDYTLGRAGRRASTSAVRIGNMSVNVPSRVEGGGRNARLIINLPQRPPILAGVQQTDRVSVTVNNETRTYLSGSAMRMKEVAYACWGS